MLALISHWRLFGVGLLVLALGVQSARLSHTTGQRDKARAEALQMRQERDRLVDLLSRTTAEAKAAYDRLQASCASERKAAVRSGRAIEKAIHAPSDPAAPRGLVDSDDLRAIVAEPDAAQALPAEPDGGEPAPAESARRGGVP